MHHDVESVRWHIDELQRTADRNRTERALREADRRTDLSSMPALRDWLGQRLIELGSAIAASGPDPDCEDHVSHAGA